MLTETRSIPFVLAVVLVAAACERAAPQEQAATGGKPAYVVSDTAREAMRLMSDKPEEAAASMEKYVTANPNHADGHVVLAMAHEQLGSLIKLNASRARITHLEKAAHHYWSHLALIRELDEPAARSAALGSLARIYGRDMLNRPADAEKVGRRLVDEDGRSAESYYLLAQALGELGQYDEATEVLHKARFDLPVSEHRPLAVYMSEYVRLSPKLPRAQVQALVDDISTIADGWLTTEPGEPTGPIAKYRALTLQAERLEQDPKRRKELLAEADLWQQLADKHTAAETADLMNKLKELQKRRAGTAK